MEGSEVDKLLMVFIHFGFINLGVLVSCLPQFLKLVHLQKASPAASKERLRNLMAQ